MRLRVESFNLKFRAMKQVNLQLTEPFGCLKRLS